MSFAALLLFAKDPERWHEKVYVEYIRFRGTQRKHGAKLNIGPACRTLGEGRLVNGDLRRIWGLDRQAALRRAKNLLEAGWLVANGNRRGRYYVAGPKVG